MSKRFEARAASRDVGIVCERASFKPAVSPAAPKLGGLGERELAFRNGPAPIPRRLSDQLALRHNQQKSVEIKI
jgi:hypothetical protein